ncbi:NAD-dependent protein deacetylase, SIR2 family [Pyrodictium delaneyi]|uniref:NAD-dependent protein deacylase n=1 Tax=Pyrodictium delaneyi TaxID=1273541 RepID=A0A0P0N455_9CREN|nr:NAD-dependent protein deacetylase [Pyrodictium delaneyi]ALL01543.1 NAD-dependent protein deacetylase, SIR2 family [Pyrodictium delaneyi]OWJ54556.1 NAD-dependent protein deacylase [Pyrodictium delaneyi]
MDPRDEARRLAGLLAESRHAIVFTGAGVSTESGIPDFRGPSGLWRRIPPEVFTIEYFLERPLEVWRLFSEFFYSFRGAKPNPAHLAIARLEELGVVKAVITQNIDGLHQAAGSRKVIELHGNLRWARCMSCGHKVALDDAVETVRRGQLPHCPRCGGLLKPDAVFFGEPLPDDALEEAFREARSADLVLVVGSSLTVYPAAYIPEYARRRGARLVIVNLEPTPLDNLAEMIVHRKAGEFLPLVVKELEKILGLNSG